MPPLELQAEFSKRRAQVSRLIAAQHTALAKAQATFDALLAQAFAPAVD